MPDDLRGRGLVQVECDGCREKGEPGWYFWLDPLDPSLPEGPFLCPTCRWGNGPMLKAET